MSWSLSKPNVSLAVTKFAPETETPVAGLTPEARAAHRAKRAAECSKVEPAIPLDEIDTGFDPPDVYDDFGNPDRDYADSVGVSLTREL